MTGTYSFGGGLQRVGRRILDHQTLLTRRLRRYGSLGRFGACPRREHLQPDIATDPVLQMNHIIAILKVGEVDVQRRARRLGMRRFEPPRRWTL